MADRLVRTTPALAVVAVAAVISYRHAYELVHSHVESGPTARLVPFTVDGIIWAASMVILDAKPPEATRTTAGEVGPCRGHCGDDRRQRGAWPVPHPRRGGSQRMAGTRPRGELRTPDAPHSRRSKLRPDPRRAANRTGAPPHRSEAAPEEAVRDEDRARLAGPGRATSPSAT
ncbi:DUF2637 domain-containing protein [Actinomadura bangladeshensis]|uniref:DUF2637 domain-containing protein n=1 Tax=Actinomadura bangladeshensis TaxID=453573 RepID=UPI0014044882